MTRRTAGQCLLGLAAAGGLPGQDKGESYQVYTEAPRLLMRPARLKLLRRERERRSLRWDQFEALWTGAATFPELGWTQALRYQIANDRDAGVRAVAWAVGPGDDIRQIALIADWCGPLISKDDLSLILGKLRREIADTRPLKTLSDARSRVFAAIVLTEAEPAASEKALRVVIEGFWNSSFIPSLKSARASVSNADAYALMEILHVVRDNVNLDLREGFPKWFEQYPVVHLMAHYPAPWPGGDNEYRIPADETIEKRGPDVKKAVLSRAAELAMVAFDSNTASSQFLQGWVTNDRFLMRGTLGIPYELLWANPYQPGLSFQHVPLALHDELGGQLFVRSSWDDDAMWIGFFGGQLQLFQEGSVTRIDPQLAHEALDIDTAVIFFAKKENRFLMPRGKTTTAAAEAANVFLVGLDAGRVYHLEVDGEEMVEDTADPGGIVYLPDVPGGIGVRLGPARV